mmetsp:Transcript_111016/g.220838  ORF Transcript_111016/g.220838 Transcript_111016/m.220838 type:complete len:235 (+) Transcript_111016:111-815(+)
MSRAAVAGRYQLPFGRRQRSGILHGVFSAAAAACMCLGVHLLSGVSVQAAWSLPPALASARSDGFHGYGDTAITLRIAAQRRPTLLAAEGLEGFFGQVAETVKDAAESVQDTLEKDPAPREEEGEIWRALTKIRLRKEPSITAPQFEGAVIQDGASGFLNAGDRFVVAEKRRAKVPTKGRHRLYLRIATTKAWAFDIGVSGKYEGVTIAERDRDAAGNFFKRKVTRKGVKNPFR